MQVLLLLALIYAIWFFFKNQKRIKNAYDEVQAKKVRPQTKTGVPAVQDLVPCPKCGAYIAAGEAHTCDSPR